MDFSKEEHQKQLATFKKGHDIPYYVTKRKRKDGAILDILASYRAINENNILAVAMYKDFTEQMEIQRRLQESEDCYRCLVEYIPDAIFVEKDGRTIFVNESVIKVTGASTMEELIGKSLSDLVVNQTATSFSRQIKTAAATHEPIIEQLRRYDGELFWGEITVMSIKFAGDEVLQILVRDVTAKKTYEEKLEYLAYHDPLTGLANRRHFTEQIKQAIERAEKEQAMLGLMYIDLDKFKEVNDTFGHDVGDQLLKQFAVRLKENVREGDILCRIGGDEFLVLLEDLKDRQDAIAIAARLNEASREPYQMNGKEISATTSIGIALYPQNGDSVERTH